MSAFAITIAGMGLLGSCVPTTTAPTTTTSTTAAPATTTTTTSTTTTAAPTTTTTSTTVAPTTTTTTTTVPTWATSAGCYSVSFVEILFTGVPDVFGNAKYRDPAGGTCTGQIWTGDPGTNTIVEATTMAAANAKCDLLDPVAGPGHYGAFSASIFGINVPNAWTCVA